MKILWFLEDHLSLDHPGWQRVDKAVDTLLFVESRKRASHLNYHKQKLVFAFSAMRHFAEERKKEGWRVLYYEMSKAPDTEEVLRLVESALSPEVVFLLEPNNHFELKGIQNLQRRFSFRLEILENTLFLMSRHEFLEWAGDRKRLLMESHYRRMRQKLGLLVDKEGNPEGGKWNYDQSNRKTVADWKKSGSPRPNRRPLETPKAGVDPITAGVIHDVEKWFPNNPGSLENFFWPVTRTESLASLRFFLEHAIHHFGEFQDLMVENENLLFHSVLSPMLNIGLLTPEECIEEAVKTYHKSGAPLEAVEAFLRQIIGWREFVRGVYWLKMPAYHEENFLKACLPLPEFFYTGKTELNCLKQTLGEVISTGFNHHIQRLMILGNFLLLAGVKPQDALRWFSEMYVDAHDWVMAANVLGMALFADGGFMATKPYAGAGAYISKMSNYCAGCRFRPDKKTGEDACPFNLLYWNFYDRHGEVFLKNPRTSMMVRSWQKRPQAERETILAQAREFLEGL